MKAFLIAQTILTLVLIAVFARVWYLLDPNHFPL